jgi:hypothetical protein
MDETENILNQDVPVPSMPLNIAVNSIWTQGIPSINNIFIVLSLLLVFGLDFLIIVGSSSLLPFWFMMLGIFAVFSVLFFLENFLFRKKFSNTISALDKWISVVIVIRNIIFLLNFIPLIQLLGLAAIYFLGWVIGPIYVGLILIRFIRTRKLVPLS